MAYIRQKTTLQDIKDSFPEMIFYGANTCWWTHNPDHMGRTQEGKFGLPCDPRGDVLYQTEDVVGVLKAAEEKPEYYGVHGLDTFMAAHHDNCIVAQFDPRATCLETFAEYDELLTRLGR